MMLSNNDLTSKDFRFAQKIALYGLKGTGFIFREKKRMKYDQELTEAIKKAEKGWFPYAVCLLGLFASGGLGNFFGRTAAFFLMVIWLIIYIRFVKPTIYMRTIPKPVEKHITYQQESSSGRRTKQ